jgi:lipopolysaccharide export LptBFGC system permease protein LptF
MSDLKKKHRPSEFRRKWTWRVSNAAFVLLFAALAVWFEANTVLLVIFGGCGVFALINVFLVPKRERSNGDKERT